MATFRKKGNGWEAAVCRKGIRQSKTFNTKSEATFWAASIEQEILSGKRGDIPNKTFGELLQRYAEKVSPTKRGAEWEVHRINAFLRDPIAAVALCDLSANHFSDWRDRRLLSVSAGSVLREINILSHAINTAIKDWGGSKSIRCPASADRRNRCPGID
jgi:hypothetical protein